MVMHTHLHMGRLHMLYQRRGAPGCARHGRLDKEALVVLTTGDAAHDQLGRLAGPPGWAMLGWRGNLPTRVSTCQYSIAHGSPT